MALEDHAGLNQTRRVSPVAPATADGRQRRLLGLAAATVGVLAFIGIGRLYVDDPDVRLPGTAGSGSTTSAAPAPTGGSGDPSASAAASGAATVVTPGTADGTLPAGVELPLTDGATASVSENGLPTLPTLPSSPTGQPLPTPIDRDGGSVRTPDATREPDVREPAVQIPDLTPVVEVPEVKPPVKPDVKPEPSTSSASPSPSTQPTTAAPTPTQDRDDDRGKDRGRDKDRDRDDDDDDVIGGIIGGVLFP